MENNDERARVFVHRNVLGIWASLKSPGLINDPTGEGQFGCVFDANEVLFSEEAVEWLKRVKRGHDDLGEIEVFGTDGGKTIFGWMGGPLKACFSPDDVEASKDYNPALLKSSSDVKPMQSFIEFVDDALDADGAD